MVKPSVFPMNLSPVSISLSSVQVFGAALDLKGLVVKVNETNEKVEDLLSQAEMVIVRAKGTSAHQTELH